MRKLLTVLGIALVLLVAALFLVPNQFSRHPPKAHERHQIARLQLAMMEYFNEYGRWPIDASESIPDVKIVSDEAVMNVLMAKNDELNPRKIAFHEPRLARQNKGGLILEGPDAGELLDAWGHPYHILIDTNFDNKISDPDTGNPLRRSILIYSAGPDGDPATWKDNITSWK